MATAALKQTEVQPRSQTGGLSRFLQSPFVCAIASSLLLWMGFFPLNWGWLGWVALVPLLSLCVRPKCRWVYLAAWVGGLAFGIPAVQWVRLAAPAMVVAWAGLALLLSMHFLLFMFLTRTLTLKANWPLIVSAPVVWVGLEFLRAHIDIGFSWYFLGHTQHDYLPVIQIADLFGAYGISFLLMVVNVVLLQVWMAIRSRWNAAAETIGLQWPSLRVSLPLAVVLILGALGYGFWRLSQDSFAEGPRLALVQGNIPQEIRNDPEQGEMQDLHFNQLGYEAAKAQGDLIVFPETSFTFHWIRCTPEQVAELPYYLKECYPYNRRFAEVKARDWRTPILLGVNSIIYSSERQSHVNSAILIGTDAVELGHYDKCCRVPFGEYLPFRETIPAMKYLSPYDFDYGIDPGQSLTIFELPKSGLRFGVLICYEDTVPHLARKFMQEQFDGRPLDFFINISNDGWFRGSEEHEQHLATARFRAVECRRSLARAVNMGISAIIDGNGRILALPADTWGQSKAIEGIVAATIPIDRRHSLYVLWGDVLPWACLLVLLGGIAWVPLSRARSVAE